MQLTAKEARATFGDVINRAAYGKERITVTKNGKAVAAVVSMEDLKALEDAEFELAMHTGNERLGGVLQRLAH